MKEQNEVKDLAAMAADAERRAAAGEKPVHPEWDKFPPNSIPSLDAHVGVREGEHGITLWLPGRIFSWNFKSYEHAQLFAEALLRDAARPLFAAELDALRFQAQVAISDSLARDVVIDEKNAELDALRARVAELEDAADTIGDRYAEVALRCYWLGAEQALTEKLSMESAAESCREIARQVFADYETPDAPAEEAPDLTPDLFAEGKDS